MVKVIVIRKVKESNSRVVRVGRATVSQVRALLIITLLIIVKKIVRVVVSLLLHRIWHPVLLKHLRTSGTLTISRLRLIRKWKRLRTFLAVM
jgi:RNase P/RNase MRP subunit POP5